MAGYIFTLDNLDSLKNCITSGTYSTRLSTPKNYWSIPHEGTFADYLSMKEGDNIYFFIERKIYGIGQLTNLTFDCKFLNYPHADIPTSPTDDEINNLALIKNNETSNHRCFCTFTHSPHFFFNGVDMDDVLSSKPSSFKMLRAFWKVSFIKIDDEENSALKDIILKRNEEFIGIPSKTYSFCEDTHQSILNKLDYTYKLTSTNILNSCTINTTLKHEMALELGIIDILSSNPNSIFGKWDYISHQVIASPFKPIDYMDKMDIFGYKFIPGFSTISKYLIMELKKGVASIDAVIQVMKYVDWVNKEYSFGDYSMIEAYVIASDFSPDVIDYAKQVGIRNFTRGIRPTIPFTWKSLHLVNYSYENNKLVFNTVL